MPNINERIIRVTADKGGECFLIKGSEKTAIVDTGAVYCASATIANLEKELDGRPLDYILATHTHFDHIGAGPIIKAHWPNAKIVAGKHAANILTRPNARALIKKLALQAQTMFDKEGKYPVNEYNEDLLTCDIGLEEGDTISLGDLSVKVIEGKGHTRCSVGYYIKELDFVYTSESVGILRNNGYMFACFVSSYSDAVESIKKFKALGAHYFIVPHYSSIISIDDMPNFYDDALRLTHELKDKVLMYYDQGHNLEEITDLIVDEVEDYLVKGIQPREAFALNIYNAAKGVVRDFRENKE